MRYLRFKVNEEQFSITESDGTTYYYIPCATNVEETQLSEYIDWGVQWAGDIITIDLSTYGAKALPFTLKAGPGFGDLSHSTTRLTLRLMAAYVAGRPFLDLGSGCGVLSLAAHRWGACSAIGLEVDDLALDHARDNAAFNDLNIAFIKPEAFTWEFSSPPVIAMNMIRSQQRQLLASLPQLLTQPATWFTSGILKEEADLYLRECVKRGWSLQSQLSEGEWMAFHFEASPSTLLY